MNINAFTRRDINWTAVGKNNALTPEIRQHLSQVYSTLAISVLSAAIGSYVEMQTHMIAGLLAMLSMIGLIVWISSTPKQEISKRFAMLLSLAFIQGACLGPLVERSININPSIVVTAFIGTTVLFVCFSGMSLFANRRSYFYLGSILSSGVSLLCTLSFLNLFVRSAPVFNFQLYLGLMVFCGFIVFDTQLIIEKRFAGDKDVIGHALELFIDFVAVFIRVLAILSKKEEKKKSSSRR